MSGINIRNIIIPSRTMDIFLFVFHERKSDLSSAFTNDGMKCLQSLTNGGYFFELYTAYPQLEHNKSKSFEVIAQQVLRRGQLGEGVGVVRDSWREWEVL